MSSSWKDSSDFASLTAALSQLKKKKAEDESLALLSGKLKDNDKEDSPKPAARPADADAVNEDECGREATNTNTAEENEGHPSASSELPQNESVPAEQSVAQLFPKFHCALPGHKSVVSCVSFERSGARLISGSHDATVAYWDFAGMSLDAPQPFRFIQPLGNNPIRAICPSPDSQWFLLVAATPSAKLFDRNGGQVREYAKGDPYLRDLRKTIGHVAALTGACWCAGDEDRFLTASEDGSVRQWHIGYRSASEAVFPIRSRVPQRCHVTAATCIPGWIIVGGADGVLRLFPLRKYGKSQPPPVSPYAEYQMEDRISGMASCGARFVARTVEGQVCVFEVTSGQNAQFSLVASWKGLGSSFEEASICFVDAETLFTGCKGGLARLDISKQTQHILPIDDEIACVAWNAKTGQLATGHASGKVSVFLSETGHGGARLMATASSGAKKVYGEVDISAGDLFAGTGQRRTKRKVDKIRADPMATHRPELPVYGQGQGGRLGSNVTQQIMRQVLKDTSRDVDPREALLAYAEKAAKNPKWVATAYAQTQPETILDPSLLEREAQAEEERKRRHEEMERLQQERRKRERL